MSVELISLGNFDYSGFNLTSCEEAIISYLVKHHIDSYNITINITTTELVFYPVARKTSSFMTRL